jgi:hypothetical protein
MRVGRWMLTSRWPSGPTEVYGGIPKHSATVTSLYPAAWSFLIAYGRTSDTVVSARMYVCSSTETETGESSRTFGFVVQSEQGGDVAGYRLVISVLTFLDRCSDRVSGAVTALSSKGGCYFGYRTTHSKSQMIKILLYRTCRTMLL